MQGVFWLASILLSPVVDAAEPATGARLVPQVGHLGSVAQIALSPDGTRLASAGRDGAVGIWHLPTGAMLHRLTVPDAVVAVAFTDQGKRVVGATTGGSWFTWDAATGTPLAEVSVDATWTSAQFVADGTRLLAAERDGGAATWRDDGRRGRTLEGVERVRVQSATPDGRWVVAPVGDREVGVFKGRSGAQVTALVVAPEDHRVSTVAISSDGRRVVTADGTATATVWAARSGERLFELVLDDENRRHVDVGFLPDGSVLTLDNRATFRRWEGTAVSRTLETAAMIDRGLVAGPDGLVVAPEARGGIGAWRLTDGERLSTMRGTVRPPRVLAAEGEYVAVGHEDGTATVWTPRAGGVRRVYEIGREPVESLEVHRRGLLLGLTKRRVALYNLRWGRRPIFDLEKRGGSLRSATLDFVGHELYVADPFGARAWEVRQHFSAPLVGERTDWGTVKSSGEALGEVSSFKARPRNQTLPGWLALADDGITIVDEETGQPRASLYSFEDGNWAVVDPEGRFDTGDTSLDGLRWVIDGQPYALAQLRERYYEPGLLAKLRGYNDEPLRAVPPLSSIEAPPVVHLSGPSPEGTFQVRIEDRGSGYGGLFATLNGSDVTPAIQSACPALDNGEPCAVELAGLPTWMPGRDNEVRVEAFSGSGIVRSRALEVFVRAGGQPIEDVPDLWVLAVGTGDYRGSSLDLKYAPQDALRLARALNVAGARGFGPDRIHLRVLSTSDQPEVHGPPTKEALREAFAWLAESDPLDTVVIYFSGHGAAYSDGEVDDYFYLLPNVGSFEDIRDPSLRSLSTFSGSELAAAAATLPALKRLVILDTCAAGKVDAELSASRAALSSDIVRAHARARERTGAWLLAGAAADKVSYEASRFGQGVLTYALIEGMLGPALDDADLLMVSRWVAWAEAQVPKHAAGIGGVQEPVARRGSAGDFPLGQLPVTDRPRIELRKVLPVMVSARVVGRGGRQDTLRCTDAINQRLRDKAGRDQATFVHWDSEPIARTWQITGTCARDRSNVVFEGFVTRTAEDGPGDEYAIAVRGADVATVADAIVKQATPRLLTDPGE